MNNTETAKKAQKLLKIIHDSKVAEINGRSYEIMAFTHKKRTKIWAYFSSVNQLMELGDFGFMDTPKFREIELLIFENTIFEKNKLSEIHFEKYPNDYIEYITTMMGAISYPFFSESLTN